MGYVYLLTVCNIFEILKCTKMKGLKTNGYINKKIKLLNHLKVVINKLSIV
jgi:hypothetical protein